MGSCALKIFLLLGIMLVTLGLLVEVNNWRRRKRVINSRQQIIRLFTGLLLIVLFGMMLAGGPSMRENPFAYLLYWMGCFVIGCLVVMLMLLDLREVGKNYQKQHRDIMRRLREEKKQ